MAINTATATVKGGLYETNGATPLATIGENGARRHIRRLLNQNGMKAEWGLMRTLNGVIPGTVSTVTRRRIVAAEELGGKRATEAITLINRASTAGDVTEINQQMTQIPSTKTSFGSTPPANKDGNPLGTR